VYNPEYITHNSETSLENISCIGEVINPKVNLAVTYAMDLGVK
jgi:hypothetical protein